ncbi:MAG: SMC-Scp complex subunit ScpB [Desulfobacterales bacterium]
MDDIKPIIECLLFISENPLSVDRIKRVLETTDGREIRKTVSELAEEYENRQGGIVLREVAGGFQFRTHPDYAHWIKKLVQPGPQRLSKAALETLSIVAYKQPIIRSDIEFIRGVDCGGILRMLLEKKLIRVLGKKEIPGRPLIYATTRQFLELFDLKDLKDLPSPREIEALGELSMVEKEEGKSDPGESEPVEQADEYDENNDREPPPDEGASEEKNSE